MYVFLLQLPSAVGAFMCEVRKVTNHRNNRMMAFDLCSMIYVLSCWSNK